MEKTYFYQPHIRYSEGPVNRFFAVLIVASAAIPFAIGCDVPGWDCPAVRLAVYLAAAFALMAILSRQVCQRWRLARFIVYDDRLVYHGLVSSRQVSFLKVRHLWHFHILYWAGLAVVKDENSAVVIPFVIDDCGGLLADVAERLHSVGKQHLCASPRFGRLVRAARVNDRINRRIYGDLAKLGAATMAVAVAGAAVAAGLWRKPLGISLTWTGIGVAFMLSAYVAANLVIAAKEGARIDRGDNGSEDIDAATIYARVSVAVAAVYLALGIVYKWLT